MKKLKTRSVNNIPLIQWSSVRNLEIDSNSLVITSQSAQKVFEANSKYRLQNCIYVNGSSSKAISRLKEYTIPRKANTAYLIGGGQVMDVGRLLAHHWDLKVICIPTLISTDAFLVDCTGVRKSGCVSYLKTKRAEKVIIDFDLFSKLTSQLFSVGCGDVLSIFTGLNDWKYVNTQDKISSEEIYQTDIAMIAQAILDGLISQKDEIKHKSINGLKSIVDALAMEVQLCNLYGNSRPEEGGEHFFAYCIENKMPHFLHGEMVTFGVLLTGFIQKQDIKPIKKFADSVGLNYKPSGLTKKIVISTLKELSSYVNKHELRFSIYNTFSYREHAQRLESFFSMIGLE